MGREVVVAITDGRLDFGPWEQILGQPDLLARESRWPAPEAGVGQDNWIMAESKSRTWLSRFLGRSSIGFICQDLTFSNACHTILYKITLSRGSEDEAIIQMISTNATPQVISECLCLAYPNLNPGGALVLSW